MNKFDVPQDEDSAEIEIAKAFEHAGEAHLNRYVYTYHEVEEQS